MHNLSLIHPESLNYFEILKSRARTTIKDNLLDSILLPPLSPNLNLLRPDSIPKLVPCFEQISSSYCSTTALLQIFTLPPFIFELSWGSSTTLRAGLVHTIIGQSNNNQSDLATSFSSTPNTTVAFLLSQVDIGLLELGECASINLVLHLHFVNDTKNTQLPAHSTLVILSSKSSPLRFHLRGSQSLNR